MKKFLAALMAMLVWMFSVTGKAAEKAAKKPKLRHVVAFKFKEGTTPEQIHKVEDAFHGLKKKIKNIKTLEWGTNVSKENKEKGFTHCWVLSFKSDKDRDTYIEHPDHKEFGKLVGPLLADVFVFDYWSKD